MTVFRHGRRLHSHRSTAFRASAALSVAVLLLVVGCSSAAGQQEHDSSESASAGQDLPLALIYNGPQGCEECAPSIAELLHNAPHPYRTQFVGPGTGTPLNADTLAEASLYVQPGGGQDLEATWNDLDESADTLRSWISGGGSYVGLCFGGYLAGTQPGFDLLPAAVRGYTDTEGATIVDDRDAIVDVTYRGQQRHMYFQDGPAFSVEPNSGADVLATYPNGEAAVMVTPYGKGKVGVSGPHPEADETWYEDVDFTNPDGIDPDIAYDLFDTTTAR